MVEQFEHKVDKMLVGMYLILQVEQFIREWAVNLSLYAIAVFHFNTVEETEIVPDGIIMAYHFFFLQQNVVSFVCKNYN